MFEEAKPRSKYPDLSDLPKPFISELYTLLTATIGRLSPPGSRYLEDARSAISRFGPNSVVSIPYFVGILSALRRDYLDGCLISFSELIHGDLFSDILEQAQYLLDENFKDPAAVLAGGVLEQELRKLCDKHGIATTNADGRPKKADAMNSELATLYDKQKLDQKNVTAWLDLRNKAAHGEYSRYTHEQVANTISGIRDFITRNPA